MATESPRSGMDPAKTESHSAQHGSPGTGPAPPKDLTGVLPTTKPPAREIPHSATGAGAMCPPPPKPPKSQAPAREPTPPGQQQHNNKDNDAAQPTPPPKQSAPAGKPTPPPKPAATTREPPKPPAPHNPPAVRPQELLPESQQCPVTSLQSPNTIPIAMLEALSIPPATERLSVIIDRIVAVTGAGKSAVVRKYLELGRDEDATVVAFGTRKPQRERACSPCRAAQGGASQTGPAPHSTSTSSTSTSKTSTSLTGHAPT